MATSSLAKILVTVLLISTFQPNVQSIFWGSDDADLTTTVEPQATTESNPENSKFKKGLEESSTPTKSSEIKTTGADEKKSDAFDTKSPSTSKKLRPVAASTTATKTENTTNSLVSKSAVEADGSVRKPTFKASDEPKLDFLSTERTPTAKMSAFKGVSKVSGDENVKSTFGPPMIQSEDAGSKSTAKDKGAKKMLVIRPSQEEQSEEQTTSVFKFHPRNVGYKKSNFRAMNYNVLNKKDDSSTSAEIEQSRERFMTATEPQKRSEDAQAKAICENCGPDNFATKFGGSSTLLVIMQAVLLLVFRRIVTIS